MNIEEVASSAVDGILAGLSLFLVP